MTGNAITDEEKTLLDRSKSANLPVDLNSRTTLEYRIGRITFSTVKDSDFASQSLDNTSAELVPYSDGNLDSPSQRSEFARDILGFHSTDDNSLRYLLESPLNIQRYDYPVMGDSVGPCLTSGSNATLGPMLQIADEFYRLQNWHIFDDEGENRVWSESKPPALDAVHPSLDDLTSQGLDHGISIGKAFAYSGQMYETTRASSILGQNTTGDVRVITDWVLLNASTAKQTNKCRHITALGGSESFSDPIIETADPQLPANKKRTIVYSTGRTSGYSCGQLCETLSSCVNRNGVKSRNWCIESTFNSSEDWILRGMGVPGDSGAGIVDLETNELIGQLWGRNRYDGDPQEPRLAYFTPINDIFDDIQERFPGGCERPTLPTGVTDRETTVVANSPVSISDTEGKWTPQSSNEGGATPIELNDQASGHTHSGTSTKTVLFSMGGWASIPPSNEAPAALFRSSNEGAIIPNIESSHRTSDHTLNEDPNRSATRMSASEVSSSKETPAMQPSSSEDELREMQIKITAAKKRCRDQVKDAIERRLERASASESGIQSSLAPNRHIDEAFESASFSLIWGHGVLPFLIEFLPKWCGPGHVVSVIPGKVPETRMIHIMTKKRVSRARRLCVAGHVRDLLPETYRNNTSFIFSTGRIDRNAHRRWARGLSKENLDDICDPRNPFCYGSPCIGDSIGFKFEDGEAATATLGPCLVIGDNYYWLANLHPFLKLTYLDGVASIEHPSPEDRDRCMEKGHDALCRDGLSFHLGDLKSASGRDLRTTRVSRDPFWAENGQENPRVVTDWTLFSANTGRANMMRQPPGTAIQCKNPVLSMHPVKAGAIVCATGRTSGHQQGQVGEFPAYVDGEANGTGTATLEWFIMQPHPQNDEDEWIRGGIGVEGDSGAAVVDLETNALVGQLWGRNEYFGPGPRLTYFTPILDIVDDIQEQRCEEVQAKLPQGQDDIEHEPWLVAPMCSQCLDACENSAIQDSSEDSLVVGIRSLTPVSEPSDLMGPDVPRGFSQSPGVQPSIDNAISTESIYACFETSRVAPPKIKKMQNPYSQALNEDDLCIPNCLDADRISLGKRRTLSVPPLGSFGQ